MRTPPKKSAVLHRIGQPVIPKSRRSSRFGGFDGRDFMFLEEVTSVGGEKPARHPGPLRASSLVYHRHHASIAEFGTFREQYCWPSNSLVDDIQELPAARRCDGLLAPAPFPRISKVKSRCCCSAATIPMPSTRATDRRRRRESARTVAKSSLVGPYCARILGPQSGDDDAKRGRSRPSQGGHGTSRLVMLFGDIRRGTDEPGTESPMHGRRTEEFDLETDDAGPGGCWWSQRHACCADGPDPRSAHSTCPARWPDEHEVRPGSVDEHCARRLG